jgi:hypothetical protein
METKEKPPTRYNLPVIAHVRQMIEVETNHKQNIWTFVNREELVKIVDRFRDKKTSKQYVPVSCPTAACVAGWTAMVTGGKMLVPEEEARMGTYGGVDSATMVRADGVVQDISAYARQTLGLTENEAEHLFAAHHSNRTVLRYLDEIMSAGNAGRDWAY